MREAPPKRKEENKRHEFCGLLFFHPKREEKKNPIELMEVMLSKVFVTGSMPQPVSLPALMSLSAASKNVKIIVSLFGGTDGFT